MNHGTHSLGHACIILAVHNTTPQNIITVLQIHVPVILKEFPARYSTGTTINLDNRQPRLISTTLEKGPVE